ncbi:ergothioneine biosynthesis protein EgtB [Mongoliitalea daihaiensis]|uniref:ergothioneine biosynthesis protein EgtB n=1 Tax=Mongoliitalea daihaiensis TaxID=2782006 RepID=UPI001F2F1501|nr:ergothioneine biosynthesis protein EgtB [Mongoliitalea daihaiensis]UJP65772.1 ergothioneine biosynthesis protein EgtB [Mongoliitalea daihaiensis]
MNRVKELKKRFELCRNYSGNICKPLEIEDYVPQPMIDVSPPKWHLGHTTWFFEAFVLEKYCSGYVLYHEDFSYLFNSYYNNAGDRVLRPNRGLMSRPPVREVMAYREYVTGQMLAFLDTGPAEEILDIIEIGINHEQQHQELLMYDIKYILGNQPTFPIYGEGFGVVQENRKGFQRIEEGLHSIGASGQGFCFDNELGQHQVFLPSFEIAENLVTNGEYMAFMEDGGYLDFNCWLSEGWDFILREKIVAPLYWHKKNGDWFHYTLKGFEKVDQSLPVQHVSFYEAQAFAEWSCMRLPTEFEWEVAADKLKWGQLWEWTYSAYLPYPGFQKAPGALGEYNGKFMSNQNVLRGASVATPEGHSRKTYRNFFHASCRWLFSGIRLVK